MHSVDLGKKGKHSTLVILVSHFTVFFATISDESEKKIQYLTTGVNIPFRNILMSEATLSNCLGLLYLQPGLLCFLKHFREGGRD